MIKNIKLFLNILACIINREAVILHHVKRNANGFIAQLVQSTCLTSRGSKVRILVGPPFNTVIWFHSSVGSEHLPYKQGVQGSNPCGTTIIENISILIKHKFKRFVLFLFNRYSFLLLIIHSSLYLCLLNLHPLPLPSSFLSS